jgi:preprotein translocase subunit SecD
MKELKYRLGIIALLLIASIVSLWPRNVVERLPGKEGETAVYDTVKRIPLKLGLDLKGGMYISLQPDESKGVIMDKSDLLDRALIIFRNRIDGLGVAEPNVQKGDDRIIIELPGIDDPKRAEDVVKSSAFLKFQIVDETNEMERVVPLIDRVLRDKGISKARPVASNDQGTSILKSVVTDSAQTATGSDSTGLLYDAISPGNIPGQYYVPADKFRALEGYLDLPEVKAVLKPGREILWGSDSVAKGNAWYRSLYMLESRPLLEGTDLIDARPAQDPSRGTLVEFELNQKGGRQFYRETNAHLQDYMAIVLDNRVMGDPPVIQGAISTRGQITLTGKPITEARDLAMVLKAGALPVTFKIIEQRNIGPSLGQDSIDKGIRAALLAVLLVVVIMGIYYRFAGLLAIAGLVCYVLMTMGVLAGLEAVLTLPGIAGFVLSIGIAVDANVLIFERIREELDAGKTVRTAIDEGFKHAMSAIVDSNVTAILTSCVLYQFGSGPVRGFAVTLIAGIIASMITGIFIVRTFFMIWLSRNRAAQTLAI